MANSLPMAVATLLNPKRAMTIAIKRRLTPTLVDCEFIAATQGAALMYGYNSPEELCGTWLSQSQTRECGHRSRTVSTLRHHNIPLTDGQPAPSIYITDALHPDGTIFPVVKNTTEVCIEDETYWITNVEDARGETSTPHVMNLVIPSLPDSCLPWAGQIRVADVDHLLRVHGKESLNDDNKLHNIIQKLYTGASENYPPEGGTIDVDALQISRGQCIELPPSHKRTMKFQYLVWCSVCNELGFSRTETPDKCPKCLSKLWHGRFLRDVRVDRPGRRKRTG